MNPLPPIPTPAGQRWKDFRLSGIPFIVVALAVLGVAFLWGRNLSRPDVVGEVVPAISTVASVAGGELVQLTVDQFEPVQRGQVIGKVRVGSHSAVTAGLAAAKADLLVTRARMVQDQQRNLLNYEAFRVDVLVQRVDLAAAKAHLRQAELELERAAQLVRDNILAPGVAQDGTPGYEVALRDRDALAAEVTERTRTLAEMEAMLERLRSGALPDKEPLIDDAINAAITAHEEQLRREGEDEVLRAPIDGVVTLVSRRQGENVMAGEPLIQISGATPERIVGFIRPPIAFVPKPGATVEVRTRGYPAQKASAEVVRVGVKFELFSQPLRLRGFGAAQERGLPILVKVPPDLKVYPGELVDLFIPGATP